MPLNTQAGTKDESVYGTAVVVDNFYPYLTENMVPNVIETKSKGLTASGNVQRWDQMSRVVAGWQGPHSLEVQDKGFQTWIKRILGALATGDPGDDGEITYTGTLGSLCGFGFTFQTNKPTGSCAMVNQAFTYAGCKVNTWTLTMDKEGLLTLEVQLLSKSGTSATALAAASYPTATRPFSWGPGVSVVIGGTTIPTHSVKISGDNKLVLDDFIDGTIAEPAEQDILDNLQVEVTPDWTTDAKALYDASIAMDDTNLKSVVVSFISPRVIGGTTHASLIVTCPDVSIDAPPPGVTGPAKFTPTITGTVVKVGSDVPIAMAYTTDAP